MNDTQPHAREGRSPVHTGVSSGLMLAHGPSRPICHEAGRQGRCPRSPMRRPSPRCTARGCQCSDLVRGPVLYLTGGHPALPLHPAFPSGKVTRPAGSKTWPRDVTPTRRLCCLLSVCGNNTFFHKIHLTPRTASFPRESYTVARSRRLRTGLSSSGA